MKDEPIRGHGPAATGLHGVGASRYPNELLRSFAILSVPIFEVKEPWLKRAKAK
jgi:hypothetical protein